MTNDNSWFVFGLVALAMIATAFIGYELGRITERRKITKEICSRASEFMLN